jgi:hypothetical protein
MAISFLSSFFNPIAYAGQHVSVTKAADQYATEHSPSAAINLESVTEVSFKEDRQHWIEECAGFLKARDFGYSRANCITACARKFDQDSINEEAKNAIAKRAITEKAEVQANTAKNTQVIVILIAAFLLAGLLIYLFFS